MISRMVRYKNESLNFSDQMRLFGNEAARGFLRVSISVGEQQDFTVFKAIHNRLIFRADRVKYKFRIQRHSDSQMTVKFIFYLRSE